MERYQYNYDLNCKKYSKKVTDKVIIFSSVKKIFFSLNKKSFNFAINRA